jgi:hypothetical protein
LRLARHRLALDGGAAESQAGPDDEAQRGVVSAESGAGGVAEFMGDILDKFQNLTWEAPVG